jgi:hypothetical protein
MESKTEVKLSLYERVISFAEKNGVKRHLLVACGSVVLTYAFIKVPYWFGVFMGTMLCGADYWKPDLDANGAPKFVDYAMISWFTGLFMLLILYGGYALSAFIFRKKP